MRLVAAGVSFRTAPLEVRERVAVTDADAPNLLRYLIGHAGLLGAAVLSTCNRTEFYVTCPDQDSARLVARRLALYLDPVGSTDLSSHVVAREGAEAVGHMFRVAAGLESMIVGETQVLGQFKGAHRRAAEAGSLDARLDFTMRRAISAGKRVRSDTAIGSGVSSLGEAAVLCARDAAGDLRGRGVLLIGAGKMSGRAAKRLKELGASVLVTSRSESADRLAHSVGGEAVRLEALEAVAAAVDVIIASTASPDVVLDRDAVETMQQIRNHRPLHIVDIAVPRDVDPSAAAIAGVSLVDIDSLGRSLARGTGSHTEAIDDAERIIQSELSRTIAVIDERDATAPTIAALMRHAEALRRREVERTTSRGVPLDAATRERIDALTQSLIRKLLHAPIDHLRENAGDPAVALRLREAFGLDELEVNGERTSRRDARQRSGTRAD